MPNCHFNQIAKQRNFIEITLRHGYSSVNLLHIIRTSFPKTTSGWLLVHTSYSWRIFCNPFLWSNHCVKSVRIRSFSGPYSVQIREIRTKKTSNTDTFHAVNSSKLLQSEQKSVRFRRDPKARHWSWTKALFRLLSPTNPFEY